MTVKSKGLLALVLMALVLVVAYLVFLTLTGPAKPQLDVPGSADDRLLKRYPGSIILLYERRSLGDLVLPASKLAPASGAKEGSLTGANLRKIEGQRTHFLYYVGKEISPLEVVRNYQSDTDAQGGFTFFECREAACGGSPTGNVLRGDPGVLEFLYPREQALEKVESGTPAYCAMDAEVEQLSYAMLNLGGTRGFAAVTAYTTPKQRECDFFAEGTFVSVDIVDTTPRKSRTAMLTATDFANSLQASGRVALYGIAFDADKAEVKPESNATLEQVGKLMKENPALKLLVVAHTDNAGAFDANMALSQRRAAAVVSALVDRHGAMPEQLRAVGASSSAPVASNKADDGRANNRRVELVEQ